MAKIGILTFHKSLNYGAFMQAYSLFRKISEDFPDDEVQIIDYCALQVQKKYSYNLITYIFSSLPEWKQTGIKTVCKATIKNFLNICSHRNFLKKRKKMRAAFDQALKYIKLPSESICTDDCAKVTKWLNNRYDILIVGSDCVWEFNNYPFPNIYFLHDVNNVKKYSYAACAQGILYEKLNKFQRKYLLESWKQFEYLGVRDYATENLLKSVDETFTLHHNCDPTVFLNMDWLPVNINTLYKKFETLGVNFSKPTVCLMGNEYVGKICREVLGNNYQIVAVFEENKYADYFIYDLNPFEWAKSFSLFQLTFTNRFHGTLLSLKNGVSPLTFDFAAADHTYSNKGNTKIRDLYERLGLVDKHYYIGKREYSDQEKQEIRNSVEELINSNERDVIKSKLQVEKKYYNDFFESLRDIKSFKGHC